ncbi:hypothetical protein, partial [Pseudomonas mediterranea]|uniref:hypothetical protein n=1 Tax=Pseudomonas mediterranea TaxID=183795 RepID=UPI000A4E65DD
MHRQDKIAIGFCLISAVMGIGKPLVPEGWATGVYYAIWLLPMLWFAPKLWNQLAPPCSLLQWWKMRRLGYSWGWAKQFHERNGFRYVSYEDGSWFWHCWDEIGTDAYEAGGGPTVDPVGAHVLG